jgi:hypothetical protein
MYAESFRALAKNDINRRTEILNAAKGVRRRRWVRSQKPKEQLSPLMTATKGATGAETKPVAATTPEAKGKPKTVGWGWGSKKVIWRYRSKFHAFHSCNRLYVCSVHRFIENIEADGS